MVAGQGSAAVRQFSMATGLLQFIRLSRLFDAVFPVVSVLIGAAAIGQFETTNTILLIIIVVIFNSVAMIWNDIEDRTVDADNGRPELEKSSARALQMLKIYTFVFALIALGISWSIGLVTFTLSIVTLGTIWAYNAKPIQASRRPIASIVILSGAGALLPFFFGISQGDIDDMTPTLLFAGTFWWIGRMSLSVLKDYKDAKGDSRHHKKTFLLRFGARRVARFSIASFAVGYTGFIATTHTVDNDPRLLILLVIAFIILVFLRLPLFHPKANYIQLDKTFRTVAQYQLLLDAGIAVWLLQ